jgi:hypothetical protein
MNKNPLNLFALVSDQDNPVRRIPLSGNLQGEITEFLIKQKENFYTDQQKVDFSGSYNAAEREVFRIQGFPLNQEIIEAVANPLRFDNLDLTEEKHRIISLFTGKRRNQQKFIAFQVFDSRRIISKGFTILHSGETYTKLENPGLTLGHKLTALFQENELLFYSYHNTRRFLDLSDYYKEATDTDLDDFASHDSLFVDDKETFMRNADSMVRKKVALLQKNNVLASVSVNDIKTSAKQYDLDMKTRNGNKIVIPRDKKKLKDLLRFLDEDYFTTILTKRKCITNSKKYL